MELNELQTYCQKMVGEDGKEVAKIIWQRSHWQTVEGPPPSIPTPPSGPGEESTDNEDESEDSKEESRLSNKNSNNGNRDDESNSKTN